MKGMTGMKDMRDKKGDMKEIIKNVTGMKV